MIWHVINRSFIHFFSSAGLILSLLVVMWMLERTGKIPPVRGWWNYIIPALASLFVIAILEFNLIGSDQNRVKSYFDVLSWAAGMGFSIWGLYRLTPRLQEILDEINASLDR